MKNLKESERVAKEFIKKGIKLVEDIKQNDVIEISDIEFGSHTEFESFMSLLIFDFIYQKRQDGASL